MKYDHVKYQLNSFRHGLVTGDKLHGRPTIVFNCETQHSSIHKIKHYQDIFASGTHNVICLPIDITGSETGDNYEIYFYHENKLKSKFHVNEKLPTTHAFFREFGAPTENFTNWHFDSHLNFVGKKSYEESFNV
jgi:hypothetical protein